MVELTLKVDKVFFKGDTSSDKSSDNIKSSDKLSAKQLVILNYIKEHPTATQKDLADNIDGLSFASAKYQINLLRKMGVLKRLGSNKSGQLIVCI